MTLGIATAIRSNRVTQILNAIDAGAGAGKLRIYSGTRPATGGTATTLLAELTMSDPAGTVSNGVLTLSAITEDAAADATGTASWFRVLDSTNAFVFDGDVGTSGSDLNLATVSIVANAKVQISSFTITDGNA